MKCSGNRYRSWICFERQRQTESSWTEHVFSFKIKMIVVACNIFSSVLFFPPTASLDPGSAQGDNRAVGASLSPGMMPGFGWLSMFISNLNLNSVLEFCSHCAWNLPETENITQVGSGILCILFSTHDRICREDELFHCKFLPSRMSFPDGLTLQFGRTFLQQSSWKVAEAFSKSVDRFSMEVNVFHRPTFSLSFSAQAYSLEQSSPILSRWVDSWTMVHKHSSPKYCPLVQTGGRQQFKPKRKNKNVRLWQNT